MIKLEAARFYDLLPPNLQDTGAQAMSAALDTQFSILMGTLPKMLVFADIQGLDHAFLDHLAVTFRVDGYSAALSLAQKRNLLEHVVANIAQKGTASAVRSVASAIYGGADIVEWFEEDATPHTYRIEVDGSNQGFDKEDYAEMRRVVGAYKPVRATLRNIGIYIPGQTQNQFQFTPHSLTIRGGFYNFGRAVQFDGAKRFDGEISFNQHQGKEEKIHITLTSTVTNQNVVGDVTLTEGRYHTFDGSIQFDGTKNFNAYTIKEVI